MTNALALPKATDMLAADNTAEIKSMVHKIMKLTSGGQSLTAEQAVELAVYCYMTDLNPFNGEAYYMKGVGIIPGVAGVRRKAIEYLAITSGPDDRFFISFRDANPGEAEFDPKAGDIAQVATLKVRSISERWQSNMLGIFTKLIDAGMETEKAWTRAEKLAGEEPSWSAAGVVDHREKFGRDPGTRGKDDPGSPDKWDRLERCKKRAEKWVIRKAFPTVILPDRELGEDNFINAQFVETVAHEIETEPKPKPRPEKEILNELGYETAETNDKPNDEPIPTENQEATANDGVPTEDEIIKAVIEAGYSKNRNSVLNTLPKIEMEANTLNDYLWWFKNYRGWRDMGATPAKAAKLINDGQTVK